MPTDFTVRSDSVNVEQIMEQIRARIREKRGVDYTEQQIREMAAVKLEKFMDPRGVRSDLLEQFRKAQPAFTPPDLPNYVFEDQTIYESTRAPIRWLRKLLNPILKLFFNPNPLIQALNIQSRLNTMYGEREARREATRRAFDQLQYELMHNLVIETTRMSIEVKNLKMRVESLSSRLEFNERRARALESVVVYQPSGEEAVSREPERRSEQGPGTTAPSSAREHQHRQESGRGPAAQTASFREAQEPGRAAAASAGEASGIPTAQGPSAGSGQGPSTGSGQGPGEGPGQRSRRRRRRRGRRGGSASAVMGGQPQAQSLEPPSPTSPEPGGVTPSASPPSSSSSASASDREPAARSEQDPASGSEPSDPQ